MPLNMFRILEMKLQVKNRRKCAERYSLLGYGAALMKALRTSETSVYFIETTRRYIPQSHNLHNRGREKLISHQYMLLIITHRYIKSAKRVGLCIKL
jgi:hypothetical protein